MLVCVLRLINIVVVVLQYYIAASISLTTENESVPKIIINDTIKLFS